MISEYVSAGGAASLLHLTRQAVHKRVDARTFVTPDVVVCASPESSGIRSIEDLVRLCSATDSTITGNGLERVTGDVLGWQEENILFYGFTSGLIDMRGGRVDQRRIGVFSTKESRPKIDNGNVQSLFMFGRKAVGVLAGIRSTQVPNYFGDPLVSVGGKPGWAPWQIIPKVVKSLGLRPVG